MFIYLILVLLGAMCVATHIHFLKLERKLNEHIGGKGKHRHYRPRKPKTDDRIITP